MGVLFVLVALILVAPIPVRVTGGFVCAEVSAQCVEADSLMWYPLICFFVRP
ncbi:hypothetical protein EV139_2990 [Leucobacter luti]|uniref:Uncharacterized protein n=1 Tax=Leucobacter luti TaxID=340320 RepID=A0A4Q7TIS3_9MICO|nr:hypothetical protein EV139_2990 [Leucobacter luti]